MNKSTIAEIRERHGDYLEKTAVRSIRKKFSHT
jgi:hypothetical protein